MLTTAIISDLVVSQHGPGVLIAALAGLMAANILAFGQFYLDKRRAAARRRRTPESTLLLLSLLGPFGAYAGMKAFRHKTRKLKFQLVPLFAVVHLFLAAVVLL